MRGQPGEPVAVYTKLGWVLSGPMKGHERVDGEANVSFVGSHPHEDTLDRNVERLWDLETLGIREKNDVHESLKDAIEFNGVRYSVGLPWKRAHKPLPSNYDNSLKRLNGQLRRLRQQPEILKEYDKIINEQLQQGIIEPVVELERPGERVHYLLHHAVVRKNAKTTKVRIVFDASSKECKRAVSLNDCLHVGPSLTPQLFHVLLRFRERRVALVADIEKAFLNVEVDKCDRDVLRFLWVRDVSDEEINPVVYRFCRVVFGVNSFPFLLNATLQYHLDRYMNVEEECVRKIKDDFYVDDLVTWDQTEDKTLHCMRSRTEF